MTLTNNEETAIVQLCHLLARTGRRGVSSTEMLDMINSTVNRDEDDRLAIAHQRNLATGSLARALTMTHFSKVPINQQMDEK